MKSWDSQEVICFRCGERGHIARYYNKKGVREWVYDFPHEEQMYCSFEKHKGPECKGKPIVEVKMGYTIVPTIVDSGCTQTMLRSDLISPPMGELGMSKDMVCIHGASYTYQRRRLQLTVLK